MGRKYTKRRKNTLKSRKNTLKSIVSKRRKNTLKSRVSKKKKSLNRRKNTVRRLKKKHLHKKRLFKGGGCECNSQWEKFFRIII